MHATTIRFPPGLWNEVAREATREKLSVAQYVRDAVLFRRAYVARTRDEAVESAPTPKPPR